MKSRQRWCSSLGRGGIYRIVHNETGREYIGKAKNFGERWNQHWRMLNAGNHPSVWLQTDWNRYNADAFTFGILEIVRDTRPCGLYPREQFHIDTRKPVYNGSPTAGSTEGLSRDHLFGEVGPVFRDDVIAVFREQMRRKQMRITRLRTEIAGLTKTIEQLDAGRKFDQPD